MACDIEHAYQQWTSAHDNFIANNRPAQRGHDYINHAKNLLPILEGIAEANAIAKAVVETFKAVVMYEDERRENDSRINILFLSLSDMMATLFNANRLLTQHREQREGENEESPFHFDSSLQSILNQIEQEIKACGNSMDVYYKEKRFVKFWKSNDWQKRILYHSNNFNNLRLKMNTTLSIQVSSDFGNKLQHMKTLLQRAYAPKANWERKLRAKIQEIEKLKNTENSQELTNDDRILKELLEIAKDSLLDSQPAGEDDSRAKAGFTHSLPTQLEQLKKDLHLSLEDACTRNLGIFEVKLDYHSRRLQEAVRNSAEYVVKSLSGPYDRLQNQDLKMLWKEMNWIFCIDKKIFTGALFEYYLDRFSTVQHGHQAVTSPEENGRIPHLSAEQEAEMQQENSDEITSLNRLGVINNADAWILDLINKEQDRISSAIDRDGSGLIRISEINTFTEQMPKGWSFPQWCAYTALGESYESRVYKTRIHDILQKIMEMQLKVLPLNRAFIVSLSPFGRILVPFFQLLAWVPKASCATGPDALRPLVHEKIKQQDGILKKRLTELEWKLDETTLKWMCPDKLEKHVLGLSILLLERAFDVLQVCCLEIIDIKEISHILSPLYFLREKCMARVKSLRTQFRKQKKTNCDPKTYSDGIWYGIDSSLFAQDTSGETTVDDEKLQTVNNAYLAPVPFQVTDVNRFLTDEISMLQDFPLRSLDRPPEAYLKYKTWEKNLQSIPEDQIPDRIPNSWNVGTADDNDFLGTSDNFNDLRYYSTEFPLTHRTCVTCKTSPIQGHHYGCVMCKEVTFCHKCSLLPAEEHAVEGHESSHPLIRFTLDAFPIQRDWMSFEARFIISQIQEDTSNMDINYSNYTIETPTPFKCYNCKELIRLDSETIFFRCIKHSCSDFFLCKDCDSSIQHERISNEDTKGHQWWHSMLVLHLHMVLDDRTPAEIFSEVVEVQYEYESSEEYEEEEEGDELIVVISKIDERISEAKAKLEAKLDTTNAMLQDGDTSRSQKQEMRMSQLEAKVDGMVAELRKFLASSGQRNGKADVPILQNPGRIAGDAPVPRSAGDSAGDASPVGQGSRNVEETGSPIRPSPHHPNEGKAPAADLNAFAEDSENALADPEIDLSQTENVDSPVRPSPLDLEEGDAPTDNPENPSANSDNDISNTADADTANEQSPDDADNGDAPEENAISTRDREDASDTDADPTFQQDSYSAGESGSPIRQSARDLEDDNPPEASLNSPTEDRENAFYTDADPPSPRQDLGRSEESGSPDLQNLGDESEDGSSYAGAEESSEE